MKKSFSQSGNLYLTPLNRVVLDNHSAEAFAEPHDIVLATYEELTNGIKIDKIMKRIIEVKK